MSVIRNDLLGISEKRIPIKKWTRELGLDDTSYIEAGIDAMQYLILHIAKVNASEEEFSIIYEDSGLTKRPEHRQ